MTSGPTLRIHASPMTQGSIFSGSPCLSSDSSCHFIVINPERYSLATNDIILLNGRKFKVCRLFDSTSGVVAHAESTSCSTERPMISGHLTLAGEYTIDWVRSLTKQDNSRISWGKTSTPIAAQRSLSLGWPEGMTPDMIAKVLSRLDSLPSWELISLLSSLNPVTLLTESSAYSRPVHLGESDFLLYGYRVPKDVWRAIF